MGASVGGKVFFWVVQKYLTPLISVCKYATSPTGGKYNQQDDEATLGQIDGKGEDQIPNNDDAGKEVDVNNNGE